MPLRSPLARAATMLEAWTLLLGVRLAMKLAARRVVSRALDRRSGYAPLSPPLRESVAAFLRVARHHAVPMLCLPRSVALQIFLARRSVPAELKIGFMRDGQRLAGHAWLEHEGKVIGDHPEIGEKFPLRPSREAWKVAQSGNGIAWRFGASEEQ